MAMAACYSSYDLSGSQGVPQHHQVQSQQQIVPISVQQSARLSTSQSSQKDYSLPLHVDCSVEYELPNQAKPPTGARIEPLLMIHPCYFRKMESQRRSPFINNMPNSSRNSSAVSIVPSSSSNSNSNTTSIRKSSRINNHQTGSNQQQQIHQHLAQQIQQHAHYPTVQQQQQQQQQSQPSRRAVIHCQNQVQISSNSAWDQIQTPSVVVAGSSGGVCNSGGLAMSNIQQQGSTVNVTGQSMYSKPIGKRDAMLSGGGCGVYSNNNNNSTLNNNISNSSDFRVSNVRWEPERSPMAAIPRDYQAGPDAMPLISNRDDKHILSGKYRQYLRSHRLHPYMTGSTGSTFPQLTTSTFPQMQQVSCYNV